MMRLTLQVKFEKILAMNDPGEKPDDGSLLIAKYGRGYFTYTGLVFFRELPAGVPGAYRLLGKSYCTKQEKSILMSKQGDDTRRTMAVVLTVVIGLVLGFIIKRVTIGLLIGLALGLLLSGLVRKK